MTEENQTENGQEDVLEQVAKVERPADPKRKLVIFQKENSDSFTAAWVARKAFGEETLEFIAASHGDDIVDCKDRQVIVLGCSYAYDGAQIQSMAAESENLVVFEYRSNAKNWIDKLLELENVDGGFSEKQSIAVQAWNFFFPEQEIPFFLEIIEDRELGRNARNGTREFSALFRTFYLEFITWDFLAHHLAHPKTASQLFEQGEAVERFEQKQIADLVRLNQRLLVIEGEMVPAVNAPLKLADDLCERLLHDPRFKFAVVYQDNEEGREFVIATAEESVDVHAIAETFGGFGCKERAEFRIPHSQAEKFIAFELDNNKLADLNSYEGQTEGTDPA